jgi:hypothetical protein
VSLSIAPDPVEPSPADALSSQIARLSELVDRAIEGDVVEGTEALAKLVGALAKLIDARTKAEAIVKQSELVAFVAGMTDSINAHVTAPEQVSLIRRDWHRLTKELTG